MSSRLHEFCFLYMEGVSSCWQAWFRHCFIVSRISILYSMWLLFSIACKCACFFSAPVYSPKLPTCERECWLAAFHCLSCMCIYTQGNINKSHGSTQPLLIVQQVEMVCTALYRVSSLVLLTFAPCCTCKCQMLS